MSDPADPAQRVDIEMECICNAMHSTRSTWWHQIVVIEPDKYGHEESVEGAATRFGAICWRCASHPGGREADTNARMRLPHSQARCYSSLLSQDARPLLLTPSTLCASFSRLSFAALPFPRTTALLPNCCFLPLTHPHHQLNAPDRHPKSHPQPENTPAAVV
jgi:hypothetical protein